MTCCASGVAIHASDVNTNIAQDRLLAASQALTDDLLQSDLLVPKMHCAACIRTIETELQKLPGVKSVRANLSTRRVSVQWRAINGRAQDFLAELAKLGFDASIFDLADIENQNDSISRHLLFCLAVAGFAAANIMLLSVSIWSGADLETTKLFHLVSGIIAVPAVIFAGQPFFRSALSALRVRRLNMDVPISLAVTLALGMSVYESLTGGLEAYFDAAVTLLFFLLIGRYLDHMMRNRARGAILRLARLMPKGAKTILENGRVAYKPLSEIAVGEKILVATGEHIPLDGIVIEGASDLDRSLVTGESTPVAVERGREVEAGVVNLTGPLSISVTKGADESFVAEVLQMMEAAEQNKSRYVRLADRAAQIYAPAVHLLAALTFVGWMIASGGDWHLSLYSAIAVLIITCPCALGLAVPIAQVVAANKLFQDGILLKDGAALEKLCDIDTAIFDKTGTLTHGDLHIKSIVGGTKIDYDLAESLASLSTHPISRAFNSPGNLSLSKNLSNVLEHPGLGIEAEFNGNRVRLGRRSWVEEISATSRSATTPSNSEVCFTATGKELVTYTLSDTLRDDAAATIDALRHGDINVEILSGDTKSTVQSIARQLGVDTYSAELKPADKIARLLDVQNSGKKVLYVGDGLNDAPALAAAHVSIAPSTGCDVGRMSADFVFTGQGLGAISTAYQVARNTNKIVRQNFTLAIIYNCIAVPIAVTGLITPLIAAIAMSTSSLVVIVNSLRLNQLKSYTKHSQKSSAASNPQDPSLPLQAAHLAGAR